MAPSVKLVYFPLRGRAEIIRLMLEVGGVKYEEEIITFEEWPNRKPEMSFLTLPVLYWDGEEICTSTAIGRFVAKKVGMYGRGEVQEARVDAILDHVSEIFNNYFEIRFHPDEEAKRTKKEAFRDRQFPNFLQVSEKRLRAAIGEYFAGSQMTMADLCMFFALDFFSSAKMMSSEDGGFSDAHEDLLKSMAGCTALTNLHRRVRARPRVAAYLRRRPDYPF